MRSAREIPNTRPKESFPNTCSCLQSDPRGGDPASADQQSPALPFLAREGHRDWHLRFRKMAHGRKVSLRGAVLCHTHGAPRLLTMKPMLGSGPYGLLRVQLDGALRQLEARIVHLQRSSTYRADLPPGCECLQGKLHRLHEGILELHVRRLPLTTQQLPGMPSFCPAQEFVQALGTSTGPCGCGGCA